MIQNWHNLSVTETLKKINSSPDGLTGEEAKQRLKKNGPNVLPQEKPYSKIKLLLSQFNSPLVYILITTVIISFFLKHYSDSFFVFIVLFINTLIGFYQENKANQSLRALGKMVKIRAKVIREGQKKEIDSEDLVAGDIVILGPGDKVPSDGRLIYSKELLANEASLTGESNPVKKEFSGTLAENTLLPERTNLVFMGTIIESGSGTMVVTSTGINTQIGKIVSLLEKTKERKTPLQLKILALSKIIGAFVLTVVFVIFLVGYLMGNSFADIFITSLALAVSAIPEGILPAITVIMALGMRRILKQNGLVKKLVATETLGCATVICTDKTGTLTEGKMRISQILTSTRELIDEDLNGLAKGENANGVESHITALKVAALTSEAFVENPHAELQEWIVRGRTTDRALLLASMQAGLDKDKLEKQYPVIDRMGFDSSRRYSAALHRLNAKKSALYVTGAPEEIIARCTHLDIDGHKKEISPFDSEKLIKKMEVLAGKGLRVIACAHSDYDSSIKYQNLSDLVVGLSLIGLIALKDPLRKDAQKSIAIAKEAGIRTIIITGDHKLTAKTIAEEVGLKTKDKNILEGKELESVNDSELKELSKRISIYARVSPQHKMRIIKALQANKEIVAMIGDGVNDAPALKSADISIAVGSGTEVAKEVADIILLDDNFKTVVKAIEQGRLIYRNIQKVSMYLIADDFSEIFLFLAAIIIGLPLPLLPAQILWINLIEDGFPDIALTTEQETKGIMEEKPRNTSESIFNRPLKFWLITVFIIAGLTAFFTFLLSWKLTGDINKTRTLIFALMSVDSLIFAFSVRSFKRTIFRKDIFSNHYLIAGVAISFGLLLAAIYLPLLNKILSTQPLNMSSWLIIFAVSLAEIALIEFSKKKIFR